MTPAWLDWSWLVAPLLAGALVLLTHVPLGMDVLRRGIVFIDLAIAQMAACGVLLAGLLDATPGGWGTQLAAALAAMLGAVLLTWTDRRWPEVQEAQIGVLFVLAATGSLLLLAHNPRAGEHMHELLAGQILWVRLEQLGLPALISLVLAGLIGIRRGRLGRLGFYLAFAVAVTVSVQLVGVYLVFASLMVPALATRQRRGPGRLIWAYGVGVLGYGLGLAGSAHYDLPAGALAVWCMTAVGMVVYALGPRRVGA